jgi:DMSO/TMAO reductase YedYZ molybdopterin-dependent catalytic subunit
MAAMADDDRSEESKLTRAKRKWAREGRFLTGRTARPEEQRLPPGQHLTQDWPVLDLGIVPKLAREHWRLDLYGALDRPVSLDWQAFMALPQSNFTTDIHCVTTWSRYDNAWAGVAVRDVLDIVQPADDATFVMLYGSDGYTTNLPLSDFAAMDALFVHRWDGAPLTSEHGGPVRVVVPHLYFWKSAKWIKAVEFLTADAPGYWEDNGYHMRGDPWAEQRYSGD